MLKRDKRSGAHETIAPHFEQDAFIHLIQLFLSLRAIPTRVIACSLFDQPRSKLSAGAWNPPNPFP